MNYNAYPGCLSKEEREEIIDRLCDQHGCNEKIAKIHYDQFVNRDWHPHPPERFEQWWKSHRDYACGVKARIAWNCQSYRDEFMEVTQIGAA